jgi:hypothetical protein
MIRVAICLLAVPLLAACQDEPAPVIVGEDSRDATGDVLGGSISDDMIPLDSLQSTSPAARETATASESSSSGRSAPAESAEPVAPAPEPVESEAVPAAPAAAPDAEAE